MFITPCEPSPRHARSRADAVTDNRSNPGPSYGGEITASGGRGNRTNNVRAKLQDNRLRTQFQQRSHADLVLRNDGFKSRTGIARKQLRGKTSNDSQCRQEILSTSASLDASGKRRRSFVLLSKSSKNASEQGYTKKQIASELGVSVTTVYQWLTGYTLTARPETIERLKKFLPTHA